MTTSLPGFDAMYAAIAGRDRRYDGAFYTAVRTTGIYCRPSCPARTPAARNVTFYPSAAAAQSAGYRACRRCVPEALPGSPAWDEAGSLTKRALQLIERGVVDEAGVEGLAARLGWSSRTVARTLVERTGASPVAHARARRARVAHALITGSAEQFADVAFAAGFASVRQFNDTIREVYGATPTELRAARAPEPSAPGTLRASLPYRAPFDWAGLLGWFAMRALPGVESVDGGTHRLALALPHGTGVAAVDDDPARSRLRATLDLADLRDFGPACAALRRLYDLDADPVGIDARLAGSPVLAPLVAATPGIRIPGTPTPLEALLRALTGQQVSVASGRAQLVRLVEGLRSGDNVESRPFDSLRSLRERQGAPSRSLSERSEHRTRSLSERSESKGHEQSVERPFPTADEILATGLDWYRGPAPRRETIRAALELASESGLDPAADPADVADSLLGLRGVGPWTVAYTLLRGYGSPDVDLTGDRAVVVAAERLGTSAQNVLGASTPWRSYAALHLWRSVG